MADDAAPLDAQDDLGATKEASQVTGTETEKEEIRRDDSENEYSQDEFEENETSLDKIDKESTEEDTEVETYCNKEEVSSDDKDTGIKLDETDDDGSVSKETIEVDSHDTQKEDLVRFTSDSEMNQDENEGGDSHDVVNNDEIFGDGNAAEETEKQEPLREASDHEDIESERDGRKNEFNVSKEEDSNENNNGNAEEEEDDNKHTQEEGVEEMPRLESSDTEKVVDSEAGNKERPVDDKDVNTEYFNSEGMEIEPSIKSNAVEQEEIDTEDEERRDENKQWKEKNDHNESEEFSEEAIKNTKDNQEKEKDDIREEKHDENELGVNGGADNGEEDAAEGEADPSAENPPQQRDSIKSNDEYVLTENVKQEDGQNELENQALSEQGSSASLPEDQKRKTKTDMDDNTCEMIKNSRHVEEASQLGTEDLLSTNENGNISSKDVETDVFRENEDDLKRDNYDQPEQTKESKSNSQERVVLEQHQLKSDKEENHELSFDENHLSEDVNETDKTMQHSDEAKKTDGKIVESADLNKIAKDNEMSKEAENIAKAINVTEITEKISVNTEIV